MNDHHFHYGYWMMGAADVALRDPTGPSQQKWGGMVGKLIADIATDERGRADFPFLRNFDPTRAIPGLRASASAPGATTRSRRRRRSTPGPA